ncbi:hypothetical protein [Streptomyces sp. B21-083]|uniref:hypothetical protein n=1 Tax=Streptomyces sp. B21-083 TaxID=3039410 RepID=UPI002FF3CAD5
MDIDVTDEHERRLVQGDPDWGQGATLHPSVWAGIQRFQVDEGWDPRATVSFWRELL